MHVLGVCIRVCCIRVRVYTYVFILCMLGCMHEYVYVCGVCVYGCMFVRVHEFGCVVTAIWLVRANQTR